MPKKLHSQITFHLANFETRSEKLAFIKSLQAIVDSFEEKLNAENELMQKQEEFSDFLESVTEEVASIISRKIFDRYVILKSSVERMDYRYTYQGEFEIKNLHFEHYAYDEEGCNTNWSLCCNGKLLMEYYMKSKVFSKVLDHVAKTLDVEKVPKRVLVKALLLCIPFEHDSNATYFPGFEFVE